MASYKDIQAAKRQESKDTLLQWLKPGDTVYTILRHVSASGMQREISLVVFKCDGDGHTYALHPDYHASRLLGSRQGKRDGVIHNGAGMDMGADLVMSLSYALFGDAYALRHEWL